MPQFRADVTQQMAAAPVSQRPAGPAAPWPYPPPAPTFGAPPLRRSGPLDDALLAPRAALVRTSDDAGALALALAGAAERDQLASSLRLAESLGAEVVVLVDEAVADALLRLARERNVSRIVVGKPARARWRDRMHRSLLRALVRGSEGIDIHVITGEREVAVKPSGRPSPGHSTAAHYLWCVALVAALTTVGSLLFPYVDRSDLIMLYIVGIMLAAVRFGRGPSTATALLSVAAFDFFYVPPFFTFAVNDGQYVLTFAVMLAVGLLIYLIAALFNPEDFS